MDMMKKTFINIGNTHAVIASADLKPLKHCLTADLIGELEGIKATAYYCACVVPSVKVKLENHFSDREFYFLSYKDLKNIDFSLVNPSTIGADRLANIAAVEALCPKSEVLTIDCGTCITGEILVKSKFTGGFIQPGRQLQRKALHDFTGALPEVPLSEKFPDAEGRTTEQAILSGVDRISYLGLQSYIFELRLKYKDLKLIFTGGDADFYSSVIEDPVIIADLTLRGLSIYAKHVLEQNN
jgi:type III pantothenate kinase